MKAPIFRGAKTWVRGPLNPPLAAAGKFRGAKDTRIHAPRIDETFYGNRIRDGVIAAQRRKKPTPAKYEPNSEFA